MNLPQVVSREDWLVARKELLTKEKEATRARDALNASRRRLPMVKIDKNYLFKGPNGQASLLDLFEGRRQLIVDHFMFDPEWDEGCPSCSLDADSVPHLAHMHARDTTFVAVSRAPLANIEAYKERMGWTFPWYSSQGSDFNYDFHVTLDDTVAPVVRNYRDEAELEQAGTPWSAQRRGEWPGISVFMRDGTDVFHTYSAYARGDDHLNNTHNYLDLTPLGRQEDWEDSPEGWPQTPTGEWFRRHDQYSI